MPEATNTPTTSGSAAASTHPDAHLLRLGALLEAASAQECAAWADPDREGECAMLNCVTSGVVDQIERTHASTLEGLLVKMRAITWCRSGNPVSISDFDDGDSPATDMRVLSGLVRDISEMATME